MTVPANPNPYTFTAATLGPAGRPPDPPGYFQGMKLAGGSKRYLSAFIDYGLTAFLPVLILGPLTDWLGHGERIMWFLVVTATMYNSAFLPSVTGQSLGKRLLNVYMVQITSAEPRVTGGILMVYVPAWLCVARPFIHLISNFVCLPASLLFPALHKRKASFADVLCRTYNYNGPLPFDIERRPKGVYAIWG